ncbi:MAG: histidinol-phosphatase [Actinomycetota bacterium]|nr:histidinol-phosphatase [Actinomycetota bacterium]
MSPRPDPSPAPFTLEALRFAHTLADLSDAITLPAFRQGRADRWQPPSGQPAADAGPEFELKADGSPVTQADRAAEDAMRRTIAERFPSHAVLGEEEGLQGPCDAPTWILDPIDGTKNFIRGVPVFATLIALELEGRGVAAVVSAPALGIRWDGVAGGPARQDGRDMRVSGVSHLSQAHVSFGGLSYFAGATTDLITRLTGRTARQRGFGDFWQHCLVAAGGIDVALDAEVERWDLAAPKIIVEAAGGRLTAFDGADTDAGGSALTTNGLLHEAALELIGSTAGKSARD